MQRVQTMAAPPNHGRICLARSGCTRNSRNALRKTVAACSSIQRFDRGFDAAEVRRILALLVVDILARPMLARYIRFMLLLELVAYVAMAEWLHFLFCWGYLPLALAAIGAALIGRFAMVSLTTTIGYMARSPVAPEHGIGFTGSAARLLREWRAV